MSTVMSVDFTAPGPAPHPAYRRIRLASRLLGWLFTGLFALDLLLVTLVGAAFLVPFTGQHLGIGPTGVLINGGANLHAPYVPVSALPLVQRLAHIPVGVINFAPPLLIFWNLRRLFGLYARGVVFSPENAGCIRWIGACLAANAVAPFLGVCFLRALHLVIDQAWMHAYSLQELILGGVVYVIAMVMQVGHEIEEDRSQFV